MKKEYCQCEYLPQFAMKRLNYHNLLKNKCPGCSKDLEYYEGIVACPDLNCKGGFKYMSEDKFNKICRQIQEGYLSKQDYSDIY